MSKYTDLARELHIAANMLDGIVEHTDDLSPDMLQTAERCLRNTLADAERIRKDCIALMSDEELDFAAGAFEMQAYNSQPCGIQDAAADHLHALQQEHEARGLSTAVH